jgi:hypothetical protein
MLLGQCLDRLPDRIRLRFIGDGTGRVRLMERGHIGAEESIKAGHLRRFRAPLLFRMPSGAASGDGTQPPAEPRRFLQLGKGLEGQQKDLLRHILRRRTTADDRLRCQNDRIPITPDQFIEGGQVAEQSGDYQLLIGGLRVGDTADSRPLHPFRFCIFLRFHTFGEMRFRIPSPL